MPKVVDPLRRRAEVTDATFAVIVDGGINAATLQKVADRAGLNIGSVRHYFTDHAELIDFAMASMLERVSNRVQQHADKIESAEPEQRRDLGLAMLEELLPLNAERQLEVTVWLEFSTAARTRPQLADLARKSSQGTRRLIRRMLTAYQRQGAIRDDRDLGVETERLCSLIDGLSMNAVLYPQQLSRARIRKVLREHLCELAEG